MAEMDAGDRVGLTLTRDCLFLFGRDGRRIARGAALARRLARNSPRRAAERPDRSPLSAGHALFRWATKVG